MVDEEIDGGLDSDGIMEEDAMICDEECEPK